METRRCEKVCTFSLRDPRLCSPCTSTVQYSCVFVDARRTFDSTRYLFSFNPLVECTRNPERPQFRCANTISNLDPPRHRHQPAKITAASIDLQPLLLASSSLLLPAALLLGSSPARSSRSTFLTYCSLRSCWWASSNKKGEETTRPRWLKLISDLPAAIESQ